MDANPFHNDEIASECAYRRQVEAEQERLERSEVGMDRLRADLAAELGIEAGPLVDDLLDLGVSPNTASAFESLPLVEVAWADGSVDPEERWRVLREATAFGLELGRSAHALLELWLTQPPEPEIFDAWCRFASLPESSSRAPRVLAGCEAVAFAAGGVLGFGAASASEREVIGRIRRVFASALATEAA